MGKKGLKKWFKQLSEEFLSQKRKKKESLEVLRREAANNEEPAEADDAEGQVRAAATEQLGKAKGDTASPALHQV